MNNMQWTRDIAISAVLSVWFLSQSRSESDFVFPFLINRFFDGMVANAVPNVNIIARENNVLSVQKRSSTVRCRTVAYDTHNYDDKSYTDDGLRWHTLTHAMNFYTPVIRYTNDVLKYSNAITTFPSYAMMWLYLNSLEKEFLSTQTLILSLTNKPRSDYKVPLSNLKSKFCSIKYTWKL